MSKKVSIIIPCFNQEKYVKEAIESALNQTYKNIEIICVNDGSTDNSSSLIKDLVNKYKNILFFDLEKNHGVIYARNLAIDASTGDYILPLDADDKIEPTYVEKAIEILENKPEIGIVYCKAKKFGTKNKVWNLPEFNLDKFLFENCIFNCALFRKEDFYRAGKYKDNMKDGCEDWDLWLSFIELGLKPYKIDEILFNYRQYKEGSRTNHVAKSSNWKKYILKNHLNLYLENKSFILKAFENNNKINEKLKKNRKLFNLFLTLFILNVGILFWIIMLNLVY